MQFPWLDDAAIRHAAQCLLDDALGVARDRRLIDLDAILYDFLAERDNLSFGDDEDLGTVDGEPVLGKTVPLEGRILISRSLRDAQERGRYRFTVAHEIGHWILHRPHFFRRLNAPDLFGCEEPAITFVSLARTIAPRTWTRSADRPEWQANRFAVALLVDNVALREEVTRRFGGDPIARLSPAWEGRTETLRDHSRLVATSTTNGLPSLARTFGLSAEAMAVLLESHGYCADDRALL